jgi:beta-1,2-xylosyltransferase
MAEMTRDTPWRDAHRIRLHRFAANDSEELNSVLAADLESSGPLGIRSENMTTAKLTDFYFDMKLAGGPIQCSNDDGTCDDIRCVSSASLALTCRAEIEFAPHQSASELNKHKFLFDIDGNGWSGRFRRLMSTNSMVIKAGIFTEWFQPHLIPYVVTVAALTLGGLCMCPPSSTLPILRISWHCRSRPNQGTNNSFRGTPQYPDSGFDEVAEALARNGVSASYRSGR